MHKRAEVIDAKSLKAVREAVGKQRFDHIDLEGIILPVEDEHGLRSAFSVATLLKMGVKPSAIIDFLEGKDEQSHQPTR